MEWFWCSPPQHTCSMSQRQEVSDCTSVSGQWVGDLLLSPAVIKLLIEFGAVSAHSALVCFNHSSFSWVIHSQGREWKGSLKHTCDGGTGVGNAKTMKKQEFSHIRGVPVPVSPTAPAYCTVILPYLRLNDNIWLHQTIFVVSASWKLAGME